MSCKHTHTHIHSTPTCELSISRLHHVQPSGWPGWDELLQYLGLPCYMTSDKILPHLKELLERGVSVCPINTCMNLCGFKHVYFVGHMCALTIIIMCVINKGLGVSGVSVCYGLCKQCWAVDPPHMWGLIMNSEECKLVSVGP